MPKTCWSLPAPVISRVVQLAATHDLRDLCNASLVCKDWREAADGDDFARALLKARVDASEVDVTGSVFDDYVDEWFCYWDGSYGVPNDTETNYAFRPAPVGTVAGFVTVPGANILDGPCPKDILKAISRLIDLAKRVSRVGGMVMSESDSELSPIVLPWQEGVPLTADKVLQLLGAHPEVQGGVCSKLRVDTKNVIRKMGVFFPCLSSDSDTEEDSESNDGSQGGGQNLGEVGDNDDGDDEEDGDGDQGFEGEIIEVDLGTESEDGSGSNSWNESEGSEVDKNSEEEDDNWFEPVDEEKLKEDATKVREQLSTFMMEAGVPCIFYAGSDKMNPVAQFCLRRFTSTLVGGFVASLIHT